MRGRIIAKSVHGRADNCKIEHNTRRAVKENAENIKSGYEKLTRNRLKFMLVRCVNTQDLKAFGEAYALLCRDFRKFLGVIPVSE